MKQTIENAIANVQTAFPSIFTKEDVVAILEGLHSNLDSEEEVEAPSIKAALFTDDQLTTLIDNVKEAVERMLNRMDSSDLVDTGSAEFEISYGNTLELSSVEVNVDNIADEVNSTIEDEIRDYFENLEKETTMTATIDDETQD